MTITKKLSPADVQECLSIHCASWVEPTWEQSSRFLRLLIAGWEGEELDTISTEDLKGLAYAATKAPEPEPVGEPERDRGCDEMPLGVAR
mgnify:CR=1 FL=1